MSTCLGPCTLRKSNHNRIRIPIVATLRKKVFSIFLISIHLLQQKQVKIKLFYLKCFVDLDESN